MTSLYSLTPEQNRERFSGVRFRRPKAAALPPRLHPDNPLLPDEADDAPNQLHSSFQGFPLKVQIMRFAEADDPNAVQGFLELMWDGTPIRSTRVTFTTPVDTGITEFDLVLPEDYTTSSGPHELSYVLDFGGNPSEVTPLPINIDTTPPVPFAKATVPEEVERDGITKKYLDDYKFVLVTVPSYGSKKLGDLVECYFGTSLPNATLVGTMAITDPAALITFELTAAIVGTEEGLKSIFYYISDRKGNRSTTLYYTELNVSLTEPPEGLIAPSIPLFDDDTAPQLVDLADAQAPLGVGIVDEYINYLADVDELEVTFDGILQPAQKINAFPFYVDIPYRDVFNNNLGEKKVDVSYRIKRHNLRFPLDTTPPSKEVDVDLRRPGDGDGGENPDPTLAYAIVQGAVTSAPNTLRDKDIDEDVAVTVPVFAGVKDKDVVTLIWKGVEVTEAQGGVKVLDGTETGNLDFSVLWEVADAGGNGMPLLVSYKITNPDINKNEVRSRPTEVDVLIRPAVVPEVKFQHLDPNYIDWLNCGSLRPDAILTRCAEVLVSGGEPQLANQTLEFTYQGYTDSAGTVTKPDTEEKVSYTPTPQEADSGFIVKIPYQKLLATESAWGDITYSAMIDGRLEPAQRHLVRVHMKKGDGSVCDI
ncbi:hypothetical protein ABIA54_000861 [Pseudomonas sp. EB276 TE3739]|uniref:hypothetical protein n=1 Tax=Pseudomonas TaxID=286 RepID=UPI0020A1C43E|nr:hypothetical protein [Pseudomonas koreensis]MCP1475048.1 hypothetical protein [Pseudomonas koreensis]